MSGAVFSLLLGCEPGDEDRLAAELWEQGTAGLAEEPGGLRAFFEDDSRASEMMSRFGPFDPKLRWEDHTDWEQVSRDAWPPLAVGERFFLVPPWRDDPAPPGRVRLVVEPGMACGTGRHPATQLALEAMEHYVVPGSTVIDVGAGSGILTAAAQLLGASCTIACDIDPDAVVVARQRVRAPFFVGSADAVRPGIADVVVANINSETAERLRPEFERVLRSRGILIVSGFPECDAPAGFEEQEAFRRDGWLCLACRVNC